MGNFHSQDRPSGDPEPASEVLNDTPVIEHRNPVPSLVSRHIRRMVRNLIHPYSAPPMTLNIGTTNDIPPTIDRHPEVLTPTYESDSNSQQSFDSMDMFDSSIHDNFNPSMATQLFGPPPPYHYTRRTRLRTNPYQRPNIPSSVPISAFPNSNHHTSNVSLEPNRQNIHINTSRSTFDSDSSNQPHQTIQDNPINIASADSLTSDPIDSNFDNPTPQTTRRSHVMIIGVRADSINRPQRPTTNPNPLSAVFNAIFSNHSSNNTTPAPSSQEIPETTENNVRNQQWLLYVVSSIPVADALNTQDISSDLMNNQLSNPTANQPTSPTTDTNSTTPSLPSLPIPASSIFGSLRSIANLMQPNSILTNNINRNDVEPNPLSPMSPTPTFQPNSSEASRELPHINPTSHLQNLIEGFDETPRVRRLGSNEPPTVSIGLNTMLSLISRMTSLDETERFIPNESADPSNYEALLRLAEALGPARPRHASIEQVDTQLPIIVFPDSNSKDEAKQVDENTGNQVNKSKDIEKPKLTIQNIQPSTSEKCSICLMNYEAGEDIRIMNCKHGFHKICVDRWLTKYVNSCPLCRNEAVESGPTEQPPGPSIEEANDFIGEESGPDTPFTLHIRDVIQNRIVPYLRHRRNASPQSDGPDGFILLL